MFKIRPKFGTRTSHNIKSSNAQQMWFGDVFVDHARTAADTFSNQADDLSHVDTTAKRLRKPQRYRKLFGCPMDVCHERVIEITAFTSCLMQHQFIDTKSAAKHSPAALFGMMLCVAPF